GLTLLSRQRMSGASLRWTAEGGRPHVSIVIPDTAGCGLPPLRGWAHFILEAAHERSFAPLDGRGRPSPREYRDSGRRGLWSAAASRLGSFYARGSMSGASLRWTAEGGRPHASIVIPNTAGCGLPAAGLTLFLRQCISGASLPLDGRGRPSPREYRYSGHRGLWSAAPSGLGSLYARGSMSGASLRWTAEGGRPHVSIVILNTEGCSLPPLRGWAHFILEAANERSFAPLDGRGRPSPREHRYSEHRGL